MSIEALYQDDIIAKSRQARERGRLENPDLTARADNPLCGDRVMLDINLEDGAIKEVGHRVRGCALCEAAAEIIAEEAPGLKAGDIAAVADSTRDYLEKSTNADLVWPQLSLFEPVQAVKSRHECVMLPFTAVAKAFADAGKDG